MEPEPVAPASSGYAWSQLSRAIAEAQRSPDGTGQGRALAKAATWLQVINGMSTGRLLVGSRTPVAETPAWVTLEVIHGGFATGRYLAEQALDGDEQVLLESLCQQAPSGFSPREQLNVWFLSDDGQELLRSWLVSGAYQVDVPEHSALLVVCWLLDHEHFEAALDLVCELRPLMHRLRFTPLLSDTQRPRGATVHVASVAEIAGPLREATQNHRIALQTETLTVWNPLYDRLVELWSATVAGALPRRNRSGQVEGGWPGSHWPESWPADRAAWLSDFRAAQEKTIFRGRHAHVRSNFSRLRAALQKTEGDAPSLGSADLALVRDALANTITKHGEPGSDTRTSLREAQHRVASAPFHASLAHVLAVRLDGYPADGGLPEIGPLAENVTDVESTFAPPGTPIPPHLIRKLGRALEAPVTELVERGVIGSGEILARVLPQISAAIIGSSLADETLRVLFEQTYGAFRRRRGLLLLNLEHQVELDELPWIQALRPFRSGTLQAATAARATLADVSLLALVSFPQTILPNPLIRELRALASTAGLTLPLVEEVAADIFMGTFTSKWRESAAVASSLLEGSIYASYYDLPPPEF